MNHVRRSGALIALGLLACSCSTDRRERYRPRPQDEPEMDASAQPDPHTPILASHPTALDCPALFDECRPDADEVWKVLLDASEFGADARFIASDGYSAIVDLGEGDFRVAMVHKQYEPSEREETRVLEEFPAGDQHPIDIKDYQVLTCDEARAHCSLWRFEPEPTPAWRALELPDGFAPRGIASSRFQYRSGASCVYGTGMLCWADDDGQWQEEISRSDGLVLNAVAWGSGVSIAAGDQGRWFMLGPDADGGSAWQEQPPLGDATLTQIGVAFSQGAIIGDGRIQVVLDYGTPAYACEPPAADFRALFLDNGATGYAITNDGDLMRHVASTPEQPETYCSMQHLALPDPVLEALLLPCDTGFNPRILTERQLIGPVEDCPVE